MRLLPVITVQPSQERRKITSQYLETCEDNFSSMVALLLSPSLPRRILPFAVFLTAFTVVMTILFLSFDLRAARHHEVFNFTQDLDFSSVGQDNPQFIAYVKAVHIRSPLAEIKNTENISLNPQSLLIASLLNNKVNGTFVEAGAYRRGKPSTTEWLETSLGWHGLLIQADPWDFLTLRRKKRSRSSSVHACLSPTPYPKEVTYRQMPTNGDGGFPSFTRVKCFPLFSLLLAANMTKIDYLSLDAEGAEVQVLKTLPLQHVEINVISVEQKKANQEDLLEFFTAHQYKLVQELVDSSVFKLNLHKEQPVNSPRATIEG